MTRPSGHRMITFTAVSFPPVPLRIGPPPRVTPCPSDSGDQAFGHSLVTLARNQGYLASMVLLRPPRAVNWPVTFAQMGRQADTTSWSIRLTAFS